MILSVAIIMVIIALSMLMGAAIAMGWLVISTAMDMKKFRKELKEIEDREVEIVKYKLFNQK